MAAYMVQVGYTPEGWAALIRNPQDRTEAIRQAVESVGGRIVGVWGAFGDYDLVAIVEAPDNVAAAALSLAFTAGGVLRSCRTTPLISMAEVVAALRKAGSIPYKPVGR